MQFHSPSPGSVLGFIASVAQNLHHFAWLFGGLIRSAIETFIIHDNCPNGIVATVMFSGKINNFDELQGICIRVRAMTRRARSAGGGSAKPDPVYP
jgi:hypothetical protein